MSFKTFRDKKTHMTDKLNVQKTSFLNRNPILVREKTKITIKPDGLKDFCTSCMKHFVG